MRSGSNIVINDESLKLFREIFSIKKRGSEDNFLNVLDGVEIDGSHLSLIINLFSYNIFGIAQINKLAKGKLSMVLLLTEVGLLLE